MIPPLTSRDRVFVLTGAGISAESGLPTFRGADGLWRGQQAQDVATPEAFHANPEMVWQFYSERRKRHSTVTRQSRRTSPWPIWSRRSGERFFLCTQNVDSLHEQAGSNRIVHMHGRLMQTRCSREGCRTKPFDDDRMYMSWAEIPNCPECGVDFAAACLLVRRGALLDGTHLRAAADLHRAADGGNIRRGRAGCQLCSHGADQ